MNVSLIQSIKDEINPHLPKDYEVKFVIAEGSIGSIFTAVSPSSQQCIAIKTIKTMNDNNMKLKIAQEFRIQKRLEHKNIISVFGIKETGTYTMICMELLSGGDLFDLIPVGKGININKGFKIYSQLLSAVEYCHSQNIVHMDIKPENVMMSNSGRPKLIDFGLAIDHNHTPFIKMYLGTMAYSAPETFTEKQYTGYKADLFSLNVTFLTFITGERCWSRAKLDDMGYLDWHERRWDLDVYKRLPVDLLNFLVLTLDHNSVKRLSIEEIKIHNWFLRGTGNKIKKLKSPTKIINAPDIPKSQPIFSNIERMSASYDIPLSQPLDIGSVLMPELNNSEQIVKRRSRFFSKKSVSETLYLLTVVIEQQQHCVIINNTTNCITVESSSGGFSVTFRIFVYLYGGSMLVDFRRIKGDGLLFRRVFDNIKDTVTQLDLVHTYEDCLNKIQASTI